MKIVFLGDSVTAAGRDEKDPQSLGSGYVSIARDKLKNLYEDREFVIVNRGKKGETVADILARTDADAVAENPDIAVVLCGIGDVLQKYTAGRPFVPSETERDFGTILEKLKDCGAKVIVAEPFLFNVPDKRRMRRDFEALSEAERRCAQKYADAFVPLDEIFAGLSESVGIAAYSEDGVHPTHRGSRRIADSLIKKIRKFIV